MMVNCAATRPDLAAGRQAAAGLASQHPYGVAVDPTGRRLAVGFRDAPRVSIRDAHSLAPIVEADVGGIDGRQFRCASLGPATVVRSWREAQRRTRWNGAWRHFLRPFRSERTAQRSRHPDFIEFRDGYSPLRRRFRLCGFRSRLRAGDAGRFGQMCFMVRAPSTCKTRSGTALEVSDDGAIVRFGLDSGDDEPVLFDRGGGARSRTRRARSPA